ncbi:MAG TPA: hypothetical protein VLS89_19390 [Candidatus Nanopelagicales bacterium]|nr:hypothetical protein [Candidatus Nanopelagicales bacterium]
MRPRRSRGSVRGRPPTWDDVPPEFQHDLFMLRKAHAAALLRWRGHPVVTP